jgi:2-polyprenyl-3-methyl-5-hydroxy-6-metoxy-1,4-benzoquinol methylase
MIKSELRLSSDFPWHDVPGLLTQYISLSGAGKVADIGGGKRPLISPELVAKLGVDYMILDIDQDELDLADPRYSKLCVDIVSEKDCIRVGENFDFMFSMWFLEHVSDPQRVHSNIFKMLRPGGRVLHVFPTLYAFPYIVNWLAPTSLGDSLLRFIKPTTNSSVGKLRFPAFYRWCVGPSEQAIHRLEALGYVVERYTGFFGHSYYDRFPFGSALEGKLASIRLKLGWASQTALALVVLRKPK